MDDHTGLIAGIAFTAISFAVLFFYFDKPGPSTIRLDEESMRRDALSICAITSGNRNEQSGCEMRVGLSVSDFAGDMHVAFASEPVCHEVRLQIITDKKTRPPYVNGKLFLLNIEFNSEEEKQTWDLTLVGKPFVKMSGQDLPRDIVRRLCAIMVQRGGEITAQSD